MKKREQKQFTKFTATQMVNGPKMALMEKKEKRSMKRLTLAMESRLKEVRPLLPKDREVELCPCVADLRRPTNIKVDCDKCKGKGFIEKAPAEAPAIA